MKKWLLLFLISASIASSVLYADVKTTGISSNPAAVNVTAGTGDFESFLLKKLNIQNDHGIRFTGAWLGDTNGLIIGGIANPQRWTSNSLFLFDLTIDTKKLGLWPGGLLGAQILQFNGQDTNAQAGTVQGYNSLPGAPPLNRFELYQLWYRQALFNDKFFVRIGKQVPTYDFDNVIKPVVLSKSQIEIPSVSGLIFTPLFVNTSMLGVMPGYYNSAYGATLNFAPIKNWYASYGIYDGNLASGTQTGLTAPNFNGTYFDIGETGFDWLIGKNALPGNVGVGVWNQSGLTEFANLSENNSVGEYLFGSQRLWYRNPGQNDSGVSLFYQFGTNDSHVLAMQTYVGGGFTAFGLIAHRPGDSMGVGAALSWLNQNIYTQQTELMFQAYYQLKVVKDIFAEPVLSYIPHPAGGLNIDPTWAGTLRIVALF